MQSFRWRQAFFLGLVTYSASAATPVFDTFVPVLLQAGHPLWANKSGLSADVVGFALAPSLAFFIMTWDNLFNLLIHPWVGACSDRTWNRWGRRKPWIMMGVPIAALGFGLIPVALCVAGVGPRHLPIGGARRQPQIACQKRGCRVEWVLYSAKRPGELSPPTEEML